MITYYVTEMANTSTTSIMTYLFATQQENAHRYVRSARLFLYIYRRFLYIYTSTKHNVTRKCDICRKTTKRNKKTAKINSHAKINRLHLKYLVDYFEYFVGCKKSEKILMFHPVQAIQ